MEVSPILGHQDIDKQKVNKSFRENKHSKQERDKILDNILWYETIINKGFR